MKRNDDVFFFTLVDFLLQIAFFGLLLFVSFRGALYLEATQRKAEQVAFDKALEAMGVSSLTELTDELTRMAPVEELRELKALTDRNGGSDSLSNLVRRIAAEGGLDSVLARLERLRVKEEGVGKPHCQFFVLAGRKQAIPIGTVVATDDTIRFRVRGEGLDSALSLLGTTFDAVKVLPVSQFAEAFEALNQRRPDCLYTLIFEEHTNLVYARIAAGKVFRLRYVR